MSKIVHKKALAFQKRTSFGCPELDALMPAIRDAIQAQVQQHTSRTPDHPLLLRGLQPPGPLFLRGIAGGTPSLSSPSPSGGGAPTMTTKVENGVTYTLIPGPSGANRWTRTSGGGEVSSGKETAAPPTPAPQEKTEKVEEISPAEQKEVDKSFERAKFERESVSVLTRDKQARGTKVAGEALGGLLVHLDATQPGTKKYAITHLKSGAQVAGDFTDVRQAKMSVFRLARIYNWDKSAPEMFKDPLFKDAQKFALSLRINAYARPPSQLSREKGATAVEKRSKVIRKALGGDFVSMAEKLSFYRGGGDLLDMIRFACGQTTLAWLGEGEETPLHTRLEATVTGVCDPLNVDTRSFGYPVSRYLALEYLDRLIEWGWA